MSNYGEDFFTEKMIAPCGLDCTLCSIAHVKEEPCPGCNGPDEHKPIYCGQLCQILKCDKFKSGGYRFCIECTDFPCGEIDALETRYTTTYPHRESPIENLQMIRDQGMEAFLEHEREQWACKRCGGPIAVHTGICGICTKRTY